MDYKSRTEVGLKNDSLRREVTFLFVRRQMRQEMDLAWKDFFEKNPSKNEADVWRKIEERLENKQDLKHQDADPLLSKGSIATGEIAALANPNLLEKESKTNGSMEASGLRRTEKIAPLIIKRRIWWEPVPEASSYVVYVSKERSIFEPVSFSWEKTPGIISKRITGKTELVIPGEWSEFPTESGTYYIGITSKDDIGNQSAPLLLSGVFKLHAPSAPLRGGIDSL